MTMAPHSGQGHHKARMTPSMLAPTHWNGTTVPTRPVLGPSDGLVDRGYTRGPESRLICAGLCLDCQVPTRCSSPESSVSFLNAVTISAHA